MAISQALRRVPSRRPLLLAGALTAGLALVTVDVVSHGLLVELDVWVHAWRRQMASWAASLAHLVALVDGRWVLPWPLAGAALWLAWRRRSVRPLVYVGLGLLAMLGAVGAGKLLVGRTAPAAGISEVFAGGMSYPSGHVTTVLVLGWLVVRLVTELAARTERQRGRGLAYGGALVATGTALMSWAVIYLDYHWVTDVLASWLLGPLILVVLDRVSGPGWRHDRGSYLARQHRGAGA